MNIELKKKMNKEDEAIKFIRTIAKNTNKPF